MVALAFLNLLMASILGHIIEVGRRSDFTIRLVGRRHRTSTEHSAKLRLNIVSSKKNFGIRDCRVIFRFLRTKSSGNSLKVLDLVSFWGLWLRGLKLQKAHLYVNPRHLRHFVRTLVGVRPPQTVGSHKDHIFHITTPNFVKIWLIKVCLGVLYRGSNFGLFHRNEVSPLTQGLDNVQPVMMMMMTKMMMTESVRASTYWEVIQDYGIE